MTMVKFNFFVATGLIAASGIAIEFCAHFVAAFSLGQGNVEERLGSAMHHMFMAIILGSFSTLFAIVPLAFHWMEFLILYQCVMYCLLCLVGMLNGLVFLPAMVALLGGFVVKGGDTGKTVVVP